MSEMTTPDAEAYAALTDHCGVLRRPGVAAFEMTGEDRGRFLNGLVTCSVQELAPGTGTYGFLTSNKGRVLADLVVLAAEDRFWVELPSAVAAEAREHILKYRIADRVEMEPRVDCGVLTVAGPGAEAVLAMAIDPAAGNGAPTLAWEHRAVSLGGIEARLARRGLAAVPAWDLWLPEGGEGAAQAVREALVAAGAADLETAGTDAWEAVRVEGGVPRHGVDFGADHLPQETGLEELAVNYDKGCYLGQEVVARIHYRGGVNKGLVGLELDGSESGGSQSDAVDLPSPGAEVSFEGRAAGRLGSVVRSPARGRSLALAILHQRAAEPGTKLGIEGTGSASVVELPFVDRR